MITRYIKNTLLGLCALCIGTACQDKYYEDGGLANPNYDGSMLNFLETHPKFDTIARVIKLAGLENDFSQKDFTFFAPTDKSVRRLILNINVNLRQSGKDTIATLDEIEPETWKKAIQGHMFSGINRMKDYYQLDLGNPGLYPGQYYKALNSNIVNIGVTYADINGIQYAGVRRIAFSYIPDYNQMTSWYTVNVQTHDLKPKNGIVHALEDQGTVQFLDLFREVLAVR